jgi:sulfatase modifying factor 1
MKKLLNVATSTTCMLTVVAMLSSCGYTNPTSQSPGGYSTTTGLEFNEEGAFSVNDFRGQPEGPNLFL